MRGCVLNFLDGQTGSFSIALRVSLCRFSILHSPFKILSHPTVRLDLIVGRSFRNEKYVPGSFIIFFFFSFFRSPRISSRRVTTLQRNIMAAPICYIATESCTYVHAMAL